MPPRMTIQELAQAIKQRDPRLSKVPDEELVRKVLERKPEAINLIYRANERPPMGSLYERVGRRLGQDLNPLRMGDYIGQLGKAIAHPPYPQGGGLRAMGEALTSAYSRPENVIGDALAALIGGAAGSEATKGPAPHTIEGEVVPVRTPATTESAVDMATRRGPGEPPPVAGPSLEQQRALVDNLKARYAQQRASGHPDMFKTGSQLRDAMDALKTAELKQWGPAYEKSPKTLSKEGGGGANFSAADLAAFKEKWGIK
jgi:hypothetical protein